MAHLLLLTITPVEIMEIERLKRILHLRSIFSLASNALGISTHRLYTPWPAPLSLRWRFLPKNFAIFFPFSHSNFLRYRNKSANFKKKYGKTLNLDSSDPAAGVALARSLILQPVEDVSGDNRN